MKYPRRIVNQIQIWYAVSKKVTSLASVNISEPITFHLHWDN